MGFFSDIFGKGGGGIGGFLGTIGGAIIGNIIVPGIGGVIGAQIGARLSAKLRGEQLRILLGLIVLAVCVRVAYGLVATPDDVFFIGELRGGE